MPTVLLLLLLAATPEPRTVIREALQQGNLDAALEAAKPWSGTGPEALACYAALLEASGRYQEAAKARAQLRPSPAAKPTTEPVSPPKLPAEAFVAASSLALRASPSAAAPALVTVPIGTPVKVLEQSGPFARVRVALPAKPVRWVELQLDDTETPPTVRAAPASPTEGFVAAAYLAGAPPDRAALAKAALSSNPADRATALERLAALTRERETFTRLAAAAFDAGRCAIAGYAAAVLAGRGDVLGGYDVEAFDLVYGCRGDRAEARLLAPGDGDLARKKVPANACAVGEAAGPPCPFCPLAYDDENSAAARKEKRRLEKAAAAYEQRKQALDGLFTEGPYLHARLRRRAEVPSPLFAVGIQIWQEPCGDAPPPEDAGFVAHPLALPEVKPGEAIDLWLKVPGYAGYAYGLVPTSSLDEARRSALASKGSSRTAERYVSGARFVALETPTCCCD